MEAVFSALLGSFDTMLGLARGLELFEGCGSDLVLVYPARFLSYACWMDHFGAILGFVLVHSARWGTCGWGQIWRLAQSLMGRPGKKNRHFFP